MLKTLDHLNPDQQQALTYMANKIGHYTSAEIVVCYGCNSTIRHQWSPYLGRNCQLWQEYTCHYDLLLVMPDGIHIDKPAIYRRIVEAGYGDTVYVIVVQHGKLQQLLQKGDFFMCTAMHEGLRLVNNQEKPLDIPPFVKPTEQDREKTWNACLAGINKAKKLYEDAENKLEKAHHTEALILLHDCAAQLYTTLLSGYMGYEGELDSLHLLRRVCYNFLAQHFSPVQQDTGFFALLAGARHTGLAHIHPDARDKLLRQALPELNTFLHLAVAFCNNHHDDPKLSVELPYIK